MTRDLETIARRERAYELSGETRLHTESARKQLEATLKHLKPLGTGASSRLLLEQAEAALESAALLLEAARQALDAECKAVELAIEHKEELHAA